MPGGLWSVDHSVLAVPMLADRASRPAGEDTSLEARAP